MTAPEKARVVILGGGFARLQVALRLDRAMAKGAPLDVVLVNRENFTLFTPMLHEVASSDLDPTHIVNPMRKMLRRVTFFNGEVLEADLERRTVLVTHGLGESHPHELPYDHLVLALGSVTNFYGLPGLEERALTMETLGDAFTLRDRVIRNLEEADFECCPAQRRRLLTFVVAGGGVAGVETLAGVNDFLREALPFYARLAERDLRLVLVHAGPVLLPERTEKLGRYAQGKLERRGIEVRLGTRVLGMTEEGVRLSDGEEIETSTLVWTAGTSPNPLLGTLPCRKDRGRVVTDEHLQVPDWPGLWAIGDCALVPDRRRGTFQPPTAQHALREGRVAAGNLLASIQGGRMKPFDFPGLGQLAAIGRRTGVANILGINLSGFLAWWLWRSIYLSKLPRFEKKVRVALDWTLDLLFSKDLVHYPSLRTARTAGLPQVLAATESGGTT